MTTEPTEPKERSPGGPRRAFLNLQEGYFDMTEDEQMAALEPMVDALLGPEQSETR